MRLRRFHRDAGVTLVELMMAVAIMGIAVTALLTALATAVRTSGQHRSQANVNALTVSVAESIKGQTYDACPSPSYSTTAGVTYPDGYSASNVSIAIRNWNASASPPAFQNSCPGGGDDGIQEVTVTVSAPDGKASQQLAVVKRDPS